MQGDGHILMFGTLEIGHTLYAGVQRVQCFPFPELKYYASNREDPVFVQPPGVESFELSPDNVWYGRVKLLFSIAVKTDRSGGETVRIDCAYISFFYEIKLDPSGMQDQTVIDELYLYFVPGMVYYYVESRSNVK